MQPPHAPKKRRSKARKRVLIIQSRSAKFQLKDILPEGKRSGLYIRTVHSSREAQALLNPRVDPLWLRRQIKERLHDLPNGWQASAEKSSRKSPWQIVIRDSAGQIVKREDWSDLAITIGAVEGLCQTRPFHCVLVDSTISITCAPHAHDVNSHGLVCLARALAIGINKIAVRVNDGEMPKGVMDIRPAQIGIPSAENRLAVFFADRDISHDPAGKPNSFTAKLADYLTSPY